MRFPKARFWDLLVCLSAALSLRTRSESQDPAVCSFTMQWVMCPSKIPDKALTRMWWCLEVGLWWLGLDEVRTVGLPDGISGLKTKRKESSHCLCTHTEWKPYESTARSWLSTGWAQRSHQKQNPASTLILHFPPPELWGINICCLSPPVCGILWWQLELRHRLNRLTFYNLSLHRDPRPFSSQLPSLGCAPVCPRCMHISLPRNDTYFSSSLFSSLSSQLNQGLLEHTCRHRLASKYRQTQNCAYFQCTLSARVSTGYREST